MSLGLWSLFMSGHMLRIRNAHIADVALSMMHVTPTEPEPITPMEPEQLHLRRT